MSKIASDDLSNEIRLQQIKNINAAASTKELIEVWKSSFHAFGFDFLVYNLFSGFGAHEKPPFKRTYVSNIPAEVEKNYFENQAKPFDPVLKYTFNTMHPLWLSDAASLPFFKEGMAETFIKSSLDIVEDGLCIPIIGPNFIKGYIFAAYKHTKAPRQKLFENGDIINWHLIGLSHLVHTRYCKLRMSTQIKVDLTKREMDVLQCLVAGKTNREIGQNLGISVNTVSSYLKNIFLKLKTTDRVTTALKAYSLNLITAPQDIPPNQYRYDPNPLPNL